MSKIVASTANLAQQLCVLHYARCWQRVSACRMFKFYVNIFYVMGKALSVEQSCKQTGLHLLLNHKRRPTKILNCRSSVTTTVNIEYYDNVLGLSRLDEVEHEQSFTSEKQDQGEVEEGEEPEERVEEETIYYNPRKGGQYTMKEVLTKFLSIIHIFLL